MLISRVNKEINSTCCLAVCKGRCNEVCAKMYISFFSSALCDPWIIVCLCCVTLPTEDKSIICWKMNPLILAWLLPVTLSC